MLAGVATRERFAFCPVQPHISQMTRTPEERAKFQKQQSIDAARAMTEYRAAQEAERVKTARLRAARLARETSEAKAAPKH